MIIIGKWELGEQKKKKNSSDEIINHLFRSIVKEIERDHCELQKKK